MPHQTLAQALEETASFIEQAIDRIGRDEAAEAELHNLRAYIISCLKLIERNPGIEAAADDLYQASRFFVLSLQGRADTSRRGRLMREAYLRFCDRLAVAQANDHARRMGLM